jgi:hypothetical protein
LHLTGGQPLGGERDDQLIHPGQAPLPLGHDLRFEAAVAVAGHLDPDRADLGQHRLAPVPVAGVAPVPAGGVVAFVAEVIGELPLQGRLDQPLGQLRQQSTLAGQR